MNSLSGLDASQPFYRLGAAFFSVVKPRGFNNPRLVNCSAAAGLLGIGAEQLDSPEFLALASGNGALAGCPPLAMVYSGHQFGVYAPRLGDGRAIMLGEIAGSRGSWELQLKGAGKTPYSRFGDGRAVLRSTIREFLCSEAMHGLGIATTRALSIAVGDERVQRESVEPGAMLIRLARSHVRFGSFEYFHYRGQRDRVKQLADHIIDRHHPDLAARDSAYEEFFRRTVASTAQLIAHWQAVGFAHGVMNTDNMSILGDTLDYGPYGFLDNYQPGFICNHSDTQGRYAFDRQPGVGLWNCNALAHALSGLIESEALTAALEQYEPVFLDTFLAQMSRKLGLASTRPEDGRLVDELLRAMAENSVDYTLFFRRLCRFDNDDGANRQIRELFSDSAAFDGWARQYRARLQRETTSRQQRQAAMLGSNPKYVLRNYMAETAIRMAEDQQDFTEIDRLLKVLASPCDEHPDMARYAALPPPWSRDISLSCSS